jgi:transcriptional regulator of acetoin/glycerol metabolism
MVRSLEIVVADALRRYRGIDLAIVGADAEGSIVIAQGCSAEAERWMDDRGLAVGAGAAEPAVAIDLLGPVLASGEGIGIDAGDPRSPLRERWSAAAAPIVDRKVNRTIGALALICPARPLGPMLLADAEDLATRTGDGLANDSHEADRAILEAFLRLRRRRRLGVVGIGRHLLVADRHAQELLADIDQGELWERARLALADPKRSELTWLTEHIIIRNPEAVADRRGDGGIVFEVALEAASGKGKDPSPEESLDGLTGRSASWRAVVREVWALRDRPHPVLISGERGSGKVSVAVAMAAETQAEGRLALVDCAEAFVIGLPAWLQKAREELSKDDCTLILRHLDLLDETSAAALRAILEDGTGKTRILATLDNTVKHRGALGALIDQLGVGQVEIPPLRLRPDDIGPLATAIIYRHASRGYTPRLRADTLAVMRRYDWPGNVRELDTTIQSTLARRLMGDVRPDDLPLEVRSGRNIMLTTLQQREKETILGALRDNGYNKLAAASALGLARSTLYRKIEAYGIGSSED